MNLRETTSQVALGKRHLRSTAFSREAQVGSFSHSLEPLNRVLQMPGSSQDLVTVLMQNTSLPFHDLNLFSNLTFANLNFARAFLPREL